jgi:hypothetical protein
LLLQGKDPALFDCDIKAPTFRRFELVSVDESKRIYTTPNAEKGDVEFPLESYKSFVDLTLLLVRSKGLILMDGMGRHDAMVEYLLERAASVIVVCQDSLSEDQMRKCKYLRSDGVAQHPFEFYSAFKKPVTKIRTFLDGDGARFDSGSSTLALYGLDRSRINKGEIHGIPERTLVCVDEFARTLR